MIQPLRFILLLLCLPTACSHLPDIQPAPVPPIEAACKKIFLQGDWQLLHAIEAEAPGGRRQTLLGLSRISSTRRSIHCVMMTLEGMVLFQAEASADFIDIHRAVAPFDRPGMAEGIIGDLRLLFFEPAGADMQTGLSPDGVPICRYTLLDGGTQDIETQNDTRWAIRKYDQHGRLVRTVRSIPDQGATTRGVSNQVTLEAHGLAGYRLNTSLIEAESLTQQPKDK